MKGDFTRTTYKKRNHYSRVLMQQGRVQVDADWNEQLEIDAHIDRTVRRDVIGYCGGPQGNGADGQPLAGFHITPDGANLLISAGRYYVNGILAENEAASLFTEQTDFREAELPQDGGRYLIYLDVWERHLTYLDDPDIREVALNGPDTATRARIMAQVRWEAAGENDRCQDFGPGWTPTGAASTGRLAARAEPDPTSDDPCVVPEEAGYRRLENQLYRVEIHDAGELDEATFKWSRENGSVLTRWLSQDGDNLTVSSSGRDAVLGFANQQWIELTDEVREHAGAPGTLVMISNVDGNIITIDAATATGTTDLADFDAGTARIRRWESEGAESVTIPASNDGWILLEEGVQIHFQSGQFRTGDYWLIPARTVLGDVLWDTTAGTGAEGFQLAHGIHHFYCPLALGTFNGNTWVDLIDCRRLFPPLTEIERGEGCCTVTVGDGILSVGDFDDIQSAVDSLEGIGAICILPGVYHLQAPVVIDELEISISGCGRSTTIVAAGEAPALIFQGGMVEISSLTIRARSSVGAVLASSPDMLSVEDCLILNRRPQEEVELDRLAARDRFISMERMSRVPASRYLTSNQKQLDLFGAGPAITVQSGQRVTLSDNLLVGLPAVLSQGEDVEILDNEMLAGGVWVAEGSSGVKVQGNVISRGEGAGVTLGGLPEGLELPESDAGVVSVSIDDNTITGMRGSGISSTADIEQNLDLGELEDIVIHGNRIMHCGQDGPNPDLDPIAVGGIVLRYASGLRISDNRITENGGPQTPACGIFTYASLGLEVVNNHVANNGTDADPSQAENCIQFDEMEPNEGEGPFESDLATFASVDFNNQPVGFLIEQVMDTVALNMRFGTEITLVEPAPGVRLRLLGGADAAVVAIRADGSQERRDLDLSSTPQDVSFSGPDIVRMNVLARQNETWLVEFCISGGAGALEGYQAGVAALFVVGGEVSNPNLPAGATFQTGGPAAMIHDNTIVCPRGQSLIVAGVGPISISDNTLTSQGVRSQPQTSQTDIFSQLAALGPGVFVFNLGRAPGLGQAAGGLRMTGSLNYTTAAFARAASPVRTTLPDGRTLFHGNQVTLEILENAPPAVTSCTALISYDDISVQDNQVLTQIVGGAVYASVAALGITIRAGGNRIHELPNQALASYYSQGLMNSATGNQGTHCIVVRGAMRIDANNQEAITTFCEILEGTRNVVGGVTRVGEGGLVVDRNIVNPGR